MHVREQIRNQAAAIITGLSTTGDNVFQRRVFQLQKQNLPCWNVVTGDEEVTVDGGNEDRLLELEFDGYARDLTGVAVDTVIDNMIEEIEQVMLKSAFAVHIQTLYLDSIELDFDVDETDQAYGSCTVIYLARYFTATGAPDVAL